MVVVEFVDDDKGFFDWMQQNPSGYFINTPRKITASSITLHRSGCQHTKGTPRPDYAHTKASRKICALTVEELQEWAKKNGRPDGSFSKICKSCSIDLSEPLALDSLGLNIDEASGYLPTKEDLKAAYRILTCPGESISIDTVLDQIEVITEKKCKLLKSDWRLITEKNIETW